MRQTLFYIPEYLGDVPLFGLGLLLALWLVVSIGLLLWLGRRHGFGGETLGYVPILTVIGAVCLLLPKLCHEQGLPIRGYGLMLLLAVSSASAMTAWRGHRLGLDPERILTLILWGFVPGIIGARTYYVIEYWNQLQRDSLLATLAQVVNLAEGGLVVYGSLIGCTLGFLIYIHRAKMPLWATFDLLVPGLMLALAIGRLGCLMNGCCYGGVCNLPWQITFPWQSPAHVHQVEHGETFLHGLKLPSAPEAEYGGPGALPLITAVEPGSPAEQQGLKPGDVITTINGQRIAAVYQAQWVLLDAYKLDILVETGQTERPYIRWTVEDPFPRGEGADQPGSLSIQRVKIVDRQGDSLAIAEVAPGCWASRQGLRPGQTIVSVNGRPESRRLGTVDELRRLIHEHQASPWISIRTRARAASTDSADWVLRPPAASEPVHPTQLYSSANALLLCLFLLAYTPFRRRDGELLAWFLTLYPITRFLLETIRTDEPPTFTGLTTAGNVSLVLLSCALALWFHILRKPPGTAFPKYQPAGSDG